MKKIIFLGPQGAGKGTIASIIKEKHKLAHISTGDIFREAINNKTELGLKAKEYIDKGNLVPDDVVIGMVKERISKPDCANGFILDGFPRTIPQAEALDKELEIDSVIVLNVPKELTLRRLSGRRQCRKCNTVYNIYPECNPNPKVPGKCDKCGGELYQRDDDKEEAIKERLKEYHEKTEPIIEYYGDKVKTIDAAQELNKIAEDTEKAIGF
ncbi:adenylate kinase [Candidatus Woesearchaeota archaeon]|nr:adenylate kinase [Candidatus Woesearchaeota archaeon]